MYIKIPEINSMKMTTALSIFFQNLECSCNDDEGNEYAIASRTPNDDDQEDRDHDDNRQEEDSSSLSEISTTSTTKSLPISAFRIQIVSDNAMPLTTFGSQISLFPCRRRNDDNDDNDHTTLMMVPQQQRQQRRRHSNPILPSSGDGSRSRRRRSLVQSSRSSSSRKPILSRHSCHHSYDADGFGVGVDEDDDNFDPPFSLFSRWHTGDQVGQQRSSSKRTSMVIHQSLIQPIRRSSSNDDVRSGEERVMPVMIENMDSLGKKQLCLRNRRRSLGDLLTSSILSHSGEVIYNNDIC